MKKLNEFNFNQLILFHTMTLSNSLSNSITLETLNYNIEDGNLKIVNKECTEFLKKEKKKYIEEFQVSVNPKKDTVFIKKGNEQIYLEIMKKLLNINISMLNFKKFMKNGNISRQKTLPSFNPEKLSDYYQRTSISDIIDFPEPLDVEKINSLESNSEAQKKISNSFSEDCSFSDASNDLANNAEISPIPFKKAKSSFGLNICMTPNTNSDKSNALRSNLPAPPQISLATCYDDDSSSSSANSNSLSAESYNSNNTTLYISQPQNISTNLITSSNTNVPSTDIQTNQIHTNNSQQKQVQHQHFKNAASAPSITPPERTKLNIQFNKKKDDEGSKKASSTYKIIGDEAKLFKIRTSISGLLHLKPNTEIQKIIFVSKM